MLIIIAGAHLLMLICTIFFIIPCSSKKYIGEQNCIYRQADTLADGQGDSTIPLKVHLMFVSCFCLHWLNILHVVKNCFRQFDLIS